MSDRPFKIVSPMSMIMPYALAELASIFVFDFVDHIDYLLRSRALLYLDLDRNLECIGGIPVNRFSREYLMAQ